MIYSTFLLFLHFFEIHVDGHMCQYGKLHIHICPHPTCHDGPYFLYLQSATIDSGYNEVEKWASFVADAIYMIIGCPAASDRRLLIVLQFLIPVYDIYFIFPLLPDRGVVVSTEAEEFGGGCNRFMEVSKTRELSLQEIMNYELSPAHSALFDSPDQLPKSATLPKCAMLFLIRQSLIQNNSIIHCFKWNNLLFVCGFWASN